jgi:hypothetical protein
MPLIGEVQNAPQIERKKIATALDMKNANTPSRHWAGQGLYLAVASAGTKYWPVAYPLRHDKITLNLYFRMTRKNEDASAHLYIVASDGCTAGATVSSVPGFVLADVRFSAQ